MAWWVREASRADLASLETEGQQVRLALMGPRAAEGRLVWLACLELMDNEGRSGSWACSGSLGQKERRATRA